MNVLCMGARSGAGSEGASPNRTAFGVLGPFPLGAEVVSQEVGRCSCPSPFFLADETPRSGNTQALVGVITARRCLAEYKGHQRLNGRARCWWIRYSFRLFASNGSRQGTPSLSKRGKWLPLWLSTFPSCHDQENEVDWWHQRVGRRANAIGRARGRRRYLAQTASLWELPVESGAYRGRHRVDLPAVRAAYHADEKGLRETLQEAGAGRGEWAPDASGAIEYVGARF